MFVSRPKTRLLVNVSSPCNSRFLPFPLQPLCRAGRGFVPRARFEVAGYLWLDVLEVDINVGYCKHLTVRISIRRQRRLQPVESEEGLGPGSSRLLQQDVT